MSLAVLDATFGLITGIADRSKISAYVSSKYLVCQYILKKVKELVRTNVPRKMMYAAFHREARINYRHKFSSIDDVLNFVIHHHNFIAQYVDRFDFTPTTYCSLLHMNSYDFKESPKFAAYYYWQLSHILPPEYTDLLVSRITEVCPLLLPELFARPPVSLISNSTPLPLVICDIISQYAQGTTNVLNAIYKMK